MASSRPTPSEDRRHEGGLAYDPVTGVLALGDHTRLLPEGATNREVLVAYVELTARCRGDRVANVVEVRHADVEALARALDLDADGLGTEIEQVLGATRADAQKVVARLRESRVIGGITKAATGAAVAGLLITGCGTGSGRAASTVPTRRPPAVTTTTTMPSQEPVTVDEQGVGLIPAATTEADGTGLIDAASQDAPGGPSAS